MKNTANIYRNHFYFVSFEVGGKMLKVIVKKKSKLFNLNVQETFFININVENSFPAWCILCQP